MNGKHISLILDNVDQHSYVVERYQEKVFEIAENLTNDFRTITIINLREESFFKATRSGLLDAYLVPKFHISSPAFEELIRKRLQYFLVLLETDDTNISNILEINATELDKKLLKLFFEVINISIRKNRRVGQDILNFINDVSGGNMRQSLRFFNTYLTSGNTDIDEIFDIESKIPADAPINQHYQIPLHHILKCIILEDYKYYKSSRSFIMNLFEYNPQYNNSYFFKIKILDYLNKRKNYFVKLENGFVQISDIIYDSEKGGFNKNDVADAMNKLANYGLVEFDNQSKEGYNYASYARITRTGIYYFEKLIYHFTYQDIVWVDTLFSDSTIVDSLYSALKYDDIKNSYMRTNKRFERTELFLNHLKEQEELEFKKLPLMYDSDITNKKYMPEILKKFYLERDRVLSKFKPDEEP
jgi:transcription initiation factor IIE alpha subunit